MGLVAVVWCVFETLTPASQGTLPQLCVYPLLPRSAFPTLPPSVRGTPFGGHQSIGHPSNRVRAKTWSF